MKQLFALTLTLMLIFSLSACGRNRNEPTTAPTTYPTTVPTTTVTVPIPDPTLDTNIPDPSVESTVPDMTEEMPGDTTDPSDATNSSRHSKQK